MKILQEKIPDRSDSFFYNGDIAEDTANNGTTFLLVATGHITIEISRERYTDSDIPEIIERFGLTDRKLNEMEAEEELVWHENNWFEVLWKEKNSDTYHCEIGEVAGNYDDAISLLKYHVDEENKKKKEIQIKIEE